MSKKARKASPDLQLGRAVEWPRSPEEAKLDRVPNPQRDIHIKDWPGAPVEGATSLPPRER